jgi:outer membrane scaffolding protein for murein synthesis (MipA/OmpV family)
MNSSGGISGLRRFQSETGMRDYGVRGAAVYSLTENWALTGVLGYRRSLGELGVNASDEHFFSVLGMGYRF